MFRQHKWRLSCIKTEIRRVADDSGGCRSTWHCLICPFFLMKALKEEPRSCTESFPTAAPTFSRKSSSQRTSGVSNRLSDVRGSVLWPSHTHRLPAKMQLNTFQNAKLFVNFSVLYRKLHLDFLPRLQIKVPPAAAPTAPLL